MGQYNMLEMCTAKPGRLARMLGFTMRTSSVGVPEELKNLVVDYIKHMIENRNVNTLGVVRKKWGMEALQRMDVTIDKMYFGAELHEGIIIWHIATDIFLANRNTTRAEDQRTVKEVKEVKALSNYMMFLLVKRPDMLPGLAQNKLYQWTKRSLATEWSKITMSLPTSDSGLQPSEKLARALYENQIRQNIKNNRLFFAIELAKILIDKKNALKLVYEVWADFLIYTANRCSRESHAKKLNSGGEFTTIVWLMTEHLHQVAISTHGDN